ncbi:thioredoxin-like domain-containing protein [uncultured Prevotella sp.]|uniref:thioredoxin-like domain-containing protein n=1 Tax=uncultured Prevotella sp. TaxID=159272 RepID=UPI002621A464|nr:thioredoxin-like domain-containing protein [uncultured Prevotella sp.]
MMKQVLFILSLFLAINIHAENKFVIEGNITNVPDGLIIELLRNEDNVGILVASDTLQNGTFRFEEETSGNGTDWMFLTARTEYYNSMILYLWVRPGSLVRISADNLRVYTWNVESDVPEQQTRSKILASSHDLWDEYQILDGDYDSLRSRIKSDKYSGEEKKKHKARLDSMKQAKSMLQDRISAVELEAMAKLDVDQAWMLNYVNTAYMVNISKNKDNLEKAKALYAYIPDSWRDSFSGREAKNVLFPQHVVEVGEEAADADLYDIDGKVWHLSDFRGKYVLIDFWSYGCGPCKMSIPEIKEAADKYKDRLVAVSISIDNEKVWKEHSASEGITWMSLSDKKLGTGIAAKYGVRGIPYFVLLSPDGKVVKKWSGYSKGLIEKNISGHIVTAGVPSGK